MKSTQMLSVCERKHQRTNQFENIEIKCNFGNNIWHNIKSKNICIAGLGAEIKSDEVRNNIWQNQYVWLLIQKKNIRNKIICKLKITGKIVWYEENQEDRVLGMGIHFDRMDSSEQYKLQNMIKKFRKDAIFTIV